MKPFYFPLVSTFFFPGSHLVCWDNRNSYPLLSTVHVLPIILLYLPWGVGIVISILQTRQLGL